MTEIGLLLLASLLEPDLKMGVTLANFQISGKMPCRKEELKIIANGLHITSPASFISIVGILSGPGAFSFFNCLMEASIKMSLTGLNFMTLDCLTTYFRGSSFVRCSISPARFRPAENHRCEVNTLRTLTCNFSVFLRFLKGVHFRKSFTESEQSDRF